MKSDSFHLGDITYDPSTRTLIQKDGRTSQLRNKSKDVLSYLLKTPNQTVTKADLLNYVWSDVTVSDESLVQCIADIRRLIGKDARQIVETVPREGYRINVQDQPEKAKPSLIAIPVLVAAATAMATWYFWPSPTDLPLTLEAGTAATATTSPPGTHNKAAFLEVLQGRVSANRFSKSESLVAEQHFRRAIALDPSYARAYAELGTLLAVRFENDWTVFADADKGKALFYAEKAVSLDPELWLAHYALGRLHSVFSNLDIAENHLEKALSLQPENEDARAYLGVLKTFQGEPEDAISILEPAIQSHPNPPYWYYFAFGHALFNAREFGRAKTALNKCMELAGKSPYCLRYLIAVHGEIGDLAQAETAGRTYETMGFKLSVSAILALMTFHHPDDRAQLEHALRLAKVPD